MNNTSQLKPFLIEYVEKIVQSGINTFVTKELERIENLRQTQIEELKKQLPKQAEKIATEAAIEIQLWKKVDEMSDQLKIIIQTK